MNTDNKMLTKKASRREWIGLAVIALPCILYSMDLTVLNLAIPHLSAELNPSATQLLWIIDMYGFMVAGFLITMGTLGDKIGRRKLLLIGAAAFGIASIFAAYARSAEMLIAARAVLGIAGATLAPSTLSLIRNMFHDDKQRTFAIGIWITSYSVGGAIGPLIGGSLLQHFHWGSVFLVSVPVMVLLLVLGPILLPEYRDPSARKLDVFSTLLSLLAVLAIILGLKQFAAHGFHLIPFLSILAGIIIGFYFIKRQQRLSDPLIDLKLFRSSAFGASLLIYMLGTFVVFSSFIYIFQYMQLLLKLSPLQAGLWSLPFFLAFIIGSLLTPAIAGKNHPLKVMATGLFISVVGFALITQVTSTGGLAFLVVGCFIYCLGMAPIFTLTTDLIVGSAPPERAGVASALSETASEFGGALGVAIIGSIGTFIYRNQLADTMPAGISDGIRDDASQTLSEAVEQSARLSEPIGQALVNAAGKAFISGMRLTAIVSMVIVTAMAILCLALYRKLKMTDQVTSIKVA